MLNALRASIGLMQQGMGPQDAEWSEKLVKRAALHLETFHDALDAIPPLQLALTSGIIMSLALLCIEVRITTAGNAARRATLSPVILKLMALSVKTNARSFSKQLTGLSACVRQLCVAVKSLWSNEDSLSTSTRLSGDIKRVLKMVTRGDCLSAHQKRLLIARDFGVRLLNKAKLDEEQQQELQGLLEDFAATGHQLEVMMLDTLSNRA
ncbi:hypothetical protein BC830DRAFT_612066 [Chytriomyces sp. MP71]|nr:hypothetical protein BC830DRAFT_612066 [Chytriomyces sp. MP71]